MERQEEGLDWQAVELKPDWPKGYTRVGAAAFHLRDWETATKAYEKGARRTRSNTCCALLSSPSQGSPRSVQSQGKCGRATVLNHSLLGQGVHGL